MYKTLMMPAGIKIDQIVALAVTLEALKATVEEVQFCFLDLDADVVPTDAVDLDARVKYSAAGFGSATEAVAKKFGVTGLEKLHEELARNNATGFMRSGEGSLALIAQKIYQLRKSTTLERDHRIEVLRHYVKVGQAYVRAARDGQLGAKTVAEIVQTPSGSSKRIHHLSGYISRLVEEGREEEAASELAWWREKFAAAARAKERAEERVWALGDIEIFVIGGRKVVYMKNVKADEIAKAVFGRYPELDVLVSVQPERAAILPNYQKGLGGKMRRLYLELEKREPGAWHFEERQDTGIVMNGGARRHAAVASAIVRDQRQLFVLMKEVWR